MALVRILVDGYSLLHNWPAVAPGQPRHSSVARDELVGRLTQYQDATGVPVTVFFDGASVKPGAASADPGAEIEVLYSKAGQTADQMIERTAHRLRGFGEVLVVTDDGAERQTVYSLGCMASSCASFVQDLERALAEFRAKMKQHNRREKSRFHRPN